MKYALILGVISLIIMVILKVVSDVSLKRGTSSQNKKISKGCKSTKSCQYMDLGTAKKAGKGPDIVYCKYCNEFLTRTDECENYLSHGCANGICANACNNERGSCYCKHYGRTVQVAESCPHYVDFFDTEDGNNLLASLNIK